MSNGKHWYIARGDNEYGPYQSTELQAMANGGRLVPTDLVWKEGLKEWIPATKLKIQFPRTSTQQVESQSGFTPDQQYEQTGPRYARQAAPKRGIPGWMVILSIIGAVAIVAVAILIPLLWSSMNVARDTAHRMQNGTQVRGIQQAMVLFAQSNKEYYPGRKTDGNIVDAASRTLPVKGPGIFGGVVPTAKNHTAVFALLMNGEFFTPEYIISPVDDLAKLATLGAAGTDLNNTDPNYSYALLEFVGDDTRKLEWRDTNNRQAPIVADPASTVRSDLTTFTYHSDVLKADATTDDYEGNIGWNDNHVTFETSSTFEAGMLKLGSISNGRPQDIMATPTAGKVGFAFD